jgi:WD40 repeat protein
LLLLFSSSNSLLVVVPAGLRGHSTAVFHAVFSPDGGTVASVDAAGVVKLWEMRTGRIVASTQIAGGAPANKCLFDPTGTLLAVGSEDSIIRLFATSNVAGGPLSELRAHTDAVQGLAFNPSTGALVSGSADGTVRTWSFENDL